MKNLRKNNEFAKRREEIIEQALNLFAGDHNCAQAVLCSFAGELEVDPSILYRMASGFGAGMGRQQKTCGALSGAYMVLGLVLGKVHDKEEIYNAVKKLSMAFSSEHGSTDCREILGYDLNKPGDYARAVAVDAFNKKCTTYIRDVIALIFEEISDSSKKY